MLDATRADVLTRAAITIGTDIPDMAAGDCEEVLLRLAGRETSSASSARIAVLSLLSWSLVDVDVDVLGG